ncbi:hypothetical protein [Lipingzhangella rawalii]|nr:hypothetical protein [Lipingzhangella rawalii]
MRALLALGMLMVILACLVGHSATAHAAAPPHSTDSAATECPTDTSGTQSGQDDEHPCAETTEASADTRTNVPLPLHVAVVGAVGLLSLWLAVPQRGVAFRRKRHRRTRTGVQTLVELCVRRV